MDLYQQIISALRVQGTKLPDEKLHELALEIVWHIELEDDLALLVGRFKSSTVISSRLSENYHQGSYLVKKATIYASKRMISSIFGIKIRLVRTFPTGC